MPPVLWASRHSARPNWMARNNPVPVIVPASTRRTFPRSLVDSVTRAEARRGFPRDQGASSPGSSTITQRGATTRSITTPRGDTLPSGILNLSNKDAF